VADKSFLQDLITSISERGRGLVGLAFPTPHARHDMIELSDQLLSGRGEASGVALASEILETFEDSTDAERLVYLEALADQFGPNVDRLEKAARAFLKSQSPSSVRELTEAAEPRRQELIRRLNLAPGGTAALVRMREEVLKHLSARPQLADLDIDFEHLFASWFNRGFLVLRRIDWTTPANILAKIIKYEAVHTIKSWEDLRARLEPPDRRCYAFFHPQLLDEPLIFVEVALTRDIPGAIAPLLEIERELVDPRSATTAVFYSISNCQKGLRGVSFGNFLIKQVVEELKRDLLELKTFVTLSPVPGFASWLKPEIALGDKSSFDEAERKALAAVLAPGWAGLGDKPGKAREALQAAAAAYFLAA
jgi:malonyl-CoA decarboxylase